MYECMYMSFFSITRFYISCFLDIYVCICMPAGSRDNGRQITIDYVCNAENIWMDYLSTQCTVVILNR